MVQPAFYLLQAYVAGAFVVLAFREITVAAAEVYALCVRPQADVYEAGARGADPVFECVFHEGNEDERRHFGVVFRRYVEVHAHIDVARQAYAHQFYIGIQKIGLLVQAYEPFPVFVEYVSQQFAQFLYRLPGLFGVECRECVDVVEGVEQEVGIDLAFQVFQFRLGAAQFRLLPCSLGFAPLGTQSDHARHEGGEQQGNETAYERDPVERMWVFASHAPHVPSAVVGHLVQAELYIELATDGEKRQQQNVVAHKLPVTFGLQIAGNEVQIIDVEDDARGSRKVKRPHVVVPVYRGIPAPEQ